MSVEEYKPDPEMRGKVLKCDCGRKILIETRMNGSVSIGQGVTCYDCLNDDQKEAVKKYYGYKEDDGEK